MIAISTQPEIRTDHLEKITRFQPQREILIKQYLTFTQHSLKPTTYDTNVNLLKKKNIIIIIQSRSVLSTVQVINFLTYDKTCFVSTVLILPIYFSISWFLIFFIVVVLLDFIIQFLSLVIQS